MSDDFREELYASIREDLRQIKLALAGLEARLNGVELEIHDCPVAGCPLRAARGAA